MSKAKRVKFNHKLYGQLARVIHDNLCDNPGACTYGKETEEMHKHDREVLRKHAEEHRDNPVGCHCWEELSCYDCQTAVDAENIAARVQFAKGSKVFP